MNRGTGFEYRVEPLGAIHPRAAFHSGVEELDQYLHRRAGQDARRKAAAVFVMLDGSGAIAGYYTLSAYGIRLGELPEAIARRLPRYPLLPATLLGRLAVDQSRRGLGLGRFLLMDALHRSWKNTAEVASIGVVAEATDDAARAFYRHHEFVELPGHPNRLSLAMATAGRAFGGL